MNIEKYTERVRGFLQSAQGLVLREGQQQFLPEHILKVLLDDPEGLAAGLIDRAGGRSREALAEVEAALKKVPKVEGGNGQIFMARATARVLQAAERCGREGRRQLCHRRASPALARRRQIHRGRQGACETGVTPTALNTAVEELRKGRTAEFGLCRERL